MLLDISVRTGTHDRGCREAGEEPDLRVAMPSAHYETIAACVEENVKLMSDAYGKVKPENRLLWNLGNALLAFSDALNLSTLTRA